MNCFNMDLEIRFNFEFGNTQRTLVEYEFCLPHLSQETTLKMQKELSENEPKDFIDSIKDSTDVTLAADDDKEILEDSFENVDAGNVKITTLDLILKGLLEIIIFKHEPQFNETLRIHSK